MGERGEKGAGGAAGGADEEAFSDDTGSDEEYGDVELISLGDKTGAGDAEPNLADDLGDKTGAGGAKPNIADDEGVVLTFLGDKTGAGGGDPNQARAVAEAEQAQFVHVGVWLGRLR